MLAMHRAASFFESAWHNEGADFTTNGEKFVLERLRSADFRLAIDVGANVGVWVHSALSLWPNCRAHAFEVAPRTYAVLEAATRDRMLEARIVRHDIGLSDRAGTQTMYYYPEQSELTGESDRHVGGIPFEARLATLDGFCHEHGIDAIDYLKIDVEGAEHRVLMGVQELLATGRITCIQFEYGAFSIDSHFLLKDYFELLSAQFFIGKIYPNYVAFGDYDWRAEDFRFANYLCVAKSHPELTELLQG